jgi:hypothetical protein
MNQSNTRKAKYGVVDPKATAEENAGKYGSRDCPGAGLGSARYSKGRSYGTIGARHAGRDYFVGRAVFKSTEAGTLAEFAARQKNPLLPPPARNTYRRPVRAREGKDLQANA